MKKKWIRVAALALAALVPAVFCGILVDFCRGTYEDTFLGELSEKYRILHETAGPKTVVVGGSSVCFGLDSALMEEYTGRPTVDFGLYASLGTKLMLDLSRKAVGEGDVVILAPETDPQTLSLYFNGESCWQALDSDFSMIRDVGRDDRGNLLGSLPVYLSSCTKLRLRGERLSPTGVYTKAAFNEKGDVSYPRPRNVMAAGYDVNNPVSLTPDIFDPEFLDYLNAYIADCRKAGAEVYFSFCPVNREGLAPETDPESLYAFFRFVCDSVNCPVISSLQDYVLDAKYFYDTNFHLNDAGTLLRTRQLIRDYYRAKGINRPVDFEIPEPETEEPHDPSGPDGPTPGDETLFLYEPFGSGLTLVGTTEAAKSAETLEIPVTAEGKTVYAIGRDAFLGCDNLREITVRDNILLIYDGAFDLPGLRKIHILAEDAESMEAGRNLFGENGKDAKIVLHSETAFANYVSGYWWGQYSGRMELENDGLGGKTVG